MTKQFLLIFLSIQRLILEVIITNCIIIHFIMIYVNIIFLLVLLISGTVYYYRFSQPRDHLQWRLVLGYYD